MTSRRVSSQSVHRRKSFDISHKLESAVEKAAGGALVEYSSSAGTGLDLYDPESQAFSSAGKMSTARTGLTATFFDGDLSQSK